MAIAIGALTQFKAPPLWKLVDGGVGGFKRTKVKYVKYGGDEWIVPFVEAALARGEDVNSKDEASTTALMFAVGSNQNSIARLLLKEPNLDVNCKNDFGETALHFAAGVGNIRGVQLLFEDSRRRLNIFNQENDFGNTPVVTAINRNEIDVLRQLVSHPSVNLETRNWRGWDLEEIARWVFNNRWIC